MDIVLFLLRGPASVSIYSLCIVHPQGFTPIVLADPGCRTRRSSARNSSRIFVGRACFRSALPACRFPARSAARVRQHDWSEPLGVDNTERINGYACWASSEEEHDVHKKPLPSAQSAVQVATVRGYSERQDRTARSQAYLSNFSQPDSVVAKPI